MSIVEDKKVTVQQLVDSFLQERRIRTYNNINVIKSRAIANGTLNSSRTVLSIKEAMAEEFRTAASEAFSIVCRVYQSFLRSDDPGVYREVNEALHDALKIVRERMDAIYRETAGPIAQNLMNKKLIGPLSLDGEYATCITRYKAELRILRDTETSEPTSTESGSMFLLRPNLFGVGLDLPQLWKRFGATVKEKSNKWLQRTLRFARRR